MFERFQWWRNHMRRYVSGLNRPTKVLYNIVLTKFAGYGSSAYILDNFFLPLLGSYLSPCSPIYPHNKFQEYVKDAVWCLRWFTTTCGTLGTKAFVRNTYCSGNKRNQTKEKSKWLTASPYGWCLCRDLRCVCVCVRSSVGNKNKPLLIIFILWQPRMTEIHPRPALPSFAHLQQLIYIAWQNIYFMGFERVKPVVVKIFLFKLKEIII